MTETKTLARYKRSGVIDPDNPGEIAAFRARQVQEHE